jgi:carbonic anhydrase/acetyltransferase-like protein (isoleucine patch superfamily)
MPIYSLGERRVELRGANHYIAPDATLAGAVVLEDSVNVWFNVVIRADNDWIRIGEASNVQDGAVLHVDQGFPLAIGRYASIGHKAMLHGCTIGDGVLIGINAVVLNGAKVGAGSLIGANSLIPEGKEIPEGVLVVGTPGKIIRQLTRQEREGLLENARGYVARAREFGLQLREAR